MTIKPVFAVASRDRVCAISPFLMRAGQPARQRPPEIAMIEPLRNAVALALLALSVIPQVAAAAATIRSTADAYALE